MTFLKKTIIAPFAFVAMAASVQAMAEPINHTIMLQATVPTSDFYVLPSDSSWIGNTQVLSYNAITGDLDSLVKSFDVKHSAGSITAQVTSSMELTGAGANIPLTVKFNNKTLGVTAVEVLTDAEAVEHRTANLEIIPTKPVGGYAPGTYDGNIQLTFDAVVAG